MGFMAGFGPAFSRSFEGARDRAHAEKQDAFRMVYQDLMDSRKRREEETAADRKAVGKAKALAESGGNPEAWPKVYEWVKNDVDDSQIMENLQTGAFEIAAQSAQPDTPTAPSSVDTQMGASGMAPAAEQTSAAAPASAPSGAPGEVDTGNPITNFLKRKAGKSGDLRREQAIEKIASSTGASVDDVRAELEGGSPVAPVDSSRVKYTPGAMTNKPDPFADGEKAYVELAQAGSEYDKNPTPRNEARLQKAQERVQALIAYEDMKASMDAKKNGVMPNGVMHRIYGPNGYETSALLNEDEQGLYRVNKLGKKEYLAEDQQIVPVSKQEEEALQRITSTMDKSRQDLGNRKAAVKGAMQTFARMDDAVQRSGGKVLASPVSGATAWVQKALFNIGVASEEVEAMMQGANAADYFAQGGQIDPSMIDTELKKLEGLHETLLSKDQNDLAVQKGLYDTQKAIFTYQLAAAMGQEGRSLAEPERKLFSQLASSGVEPEKFRQSMGAILGNMIDTVDNQSMVIANENGELQRFIETYDYEPKGVLPSKMADDLDGDEDPTIKQVWQMINPKDPNVGNEPSTETPAKPQAVEPPAGAVEMLRNNPGLAQKFDEKYGPGASAKILQGN